MIPQCPTKSFDSTAIWPLIGKHFLPLEAAAAGPIAPIGWIASMAALYELPSDFQPCTWTFDELAFAYCRSRKPVRILSSVLPNQVQDLVDAGLTKSGPLNPDAKVLVVIPHYRCEKWLNQCLHSVVNQTRPANGVVVIDDGSSEPPIDIVHQYSEATLLTTDGNVGPYRIIQAIIDATNYDAYMFQDADDWSMHDRLQCLLEVAAHTSADLVGTQEMRLFAERVPTAQVVAYPLNVNRALVTRPAHVLQHPTSLVSRQFVQLLGGYASGLQFGGDTEFLLRARFKGRIVNTATVSYARRIRSDSLTGSRETGFRSIARRRLFHDLLTRESLFAALIRNGHPIDLAPIAIGRCVALRHICGPRLIPINCSESGQNRQIQI